MLLFLTLPFASSRRFARYFPHETSTECTNNARIAQDESDINVNDVTVSKTAIPFPVKTKIFSFVITLSRPVLETTHRPTGLYVPRTTGTPYVLAEMRNWRLTPKQTRDGEYVELYSNSFSTHSCRKA